MKRTKFVIAIAVSFCLGAFAFGGTAAVAAGITANYSQDKVLVNGNPIEASIYNISGNNYLKLRDIAQAVNFGVWFDDASNTIHIETDKTYDASYAGPATQTPQALQAPQTTVVPTPQAPQTTVVPTPQAPQTITATVYITKTGEKYHRDNCSYLAQSKIAIALSEAKSSGYTPCSRCNPPV
jgi:competence protein ComEC